ncbi:Modification methylase DpnIIA [compost metagenome]
MERVLTYIGHKGKMFPVFKEGLPKNLHEYTFIEAFSGSLGLSMELLEKGCVYKILANDLDKSVISFWECVKNNPKRLVECMHNLVAMHSTYLYRVSDKELRNMLEHTAKDKYSKAALFAFYKKLNEGRVHKAIGRIPDYGRWNYERAILTASKLLKDSKLKNGSYTDLGEYNNAKTFWYFDPPYKDYDNASYYDACRGEEFDHNKLYDFIKGLKGKFILSYNNSQYIKELYKDFFVYSIRVRTPYVKEGYIDELVISNYNLNIR